MDHNTIVAFLAAGCALIPIPLGEKGPRIKGWQRRENVITGAEHATELATMNAGLVHEHSGTCALDVDDFDAADAWLTAHKINIESLFMVEDAVSVSSGRFGRGKLLYRLPIDVRPLPTVKVKDDAGRVILELRCAGSQDVIAGKHPAGGQYTVKGDPANMPALPDALLTIWRELAAGETPHTNGADHDRCDDRIPEGGRDDALFKLGCALRRTGLDQAGILAALKATNATRCDPPLPEVDVRRIAHSAATARDRESAERRVHADRGGESPAELKYLFADQLKAGRIVDEILEGLLTRSAISVIYGDSNCGKTFLAIDIACAFALGHHWMGRNVEQGFVLYLAAESPVSVEMRLHAYQKHHGRAVPNLCIVQSPINFYASGADVALIVELVRKLEAERGQKCILVVGDTLSRLASGANENSGEDMNLVVDRLVYIRTECDAHVLLIHHTGKDAAKGMCGWSGVRAIIDTEIEVTEDPATGLRAAEITKQRDIPGKGTRIGFRLEVVDIGVNKWGKPATSCVVVSADAPAKQERGKRPSEIAGAITELLTTRGTGMRKGELVDHFEDRYSRTSVYKEIRKMTADHRLTEVVGILALVSA